MTTITPNQNNTNPTSPNPTAEPSHPTGSHGRAPIPAARPACAACKHQRRRCSPYCPLAPYFPADKQKEFQNVHKLFGINNVVKLLKRVPENDREDAMRSVIYEANLRAINPVGGCYTVICDLQKQINLCTTELDVVLKQLAFCRAKLLQNFSVYDHQDTKQDTKQERVNVGMVKKFCKDLAHEEPSSSQLTDCKIVQQFLNDNPNESRGSEMLKDEDSNKPH